MRRASAAVSISVFAFFLLLAGTVASETPTSTDSDRKTDIRLVTLSPHLAELVHAVGAGNMLIGVSAYSNFPASLTALPQIGDAFLIDQEQLLLLRPDMLLAWQSGTPAHTVRDLRNRGYRVETIQTRSLDDIASALKMIGELIGHENQAVSVAAQFARNLQKLRVMHAQDEPIRVFYQISQRPLYTANSKHYISEIIEICGGENIFADLGELAPMVSEEAVIVRDPEVMIAGGIDVEDVAFVEWQRWPAMAANAQGNHFYIPADLLARPTLRLVQAANMICNVLDTARENRAQASDQ